MRHHTVMQFRVINFDANTFALYRLDLAAPKNVALFHLPV